MSIIVLFLIVLLLFGTPGVWVVGGPYYGGGIGFVLLVILIVVLLR